MDCESRCENLVRLACEQQEVRVGLCIHTLHRWYYDRHQKTCKPFVYTGCAGNENRFETKEECENTCVKD
ncbi:hypothetical protein EB796_018133 [Bugula neritina]|uniref:BPTI/Kunitz inhibitor domain-containing protein n=1 Tax=Bugula neritina TaxID=10212 RepID=A0A7J7JCA9_BUGNE|nr:hypothetical protein EB796_018133 [Bugula neritina]